ncbi:hypothetical protein BDV30DRAFT_203297 [Aspergillus minisclerotigenes]|uniref:Uncharacterized protein n=1 Tax=Aspergillus minisclerotigenes TaxID=656917 RepID=A0A5N6JL04_9EURO|nr:hypothetical protein BDV30DRAFT_203297 [Aspergillus minisclerotigenes]
MHSSNPRTEMTGSLLSGCISARWVDSHARVSPRGTLRYRSAILLMSTYSDWSNYCQYTILQVLCIFHLSWIIGTLLTDNLRRRLSSRDQVS